MMNAHDLSNALDLRPDGNSFRGPCPVCGGSDKATKFCLSERDGTVMFKCFDGCSQQEIIDELAITRVTERGSRIDDKRSDAAMEDRKKEGYF